MAIHYPNTGNFKHGHAKHDGKATPEYIAWAHMKDRCLNPRNRKYSRYGGCGGAALRFVPAGLSPLKTSWPTWACARHPNILWIDFLTQTGIIHPRTVDGRRA